MPSIKISAGMMPFMNHFLYQVDEGSLFNIESPNASYGKSILVFMLANHFTNRNLL
jgi:hypothetical protein